MRRLLATAFLAVFAAIPAHAQAPDPAPVRSAVTSADLAWKPVDAKPAAHRELVDCRSPVIAHERAVKLGDGWTLDRTVLAFERKGPGLRVTVKRPAPAKEETFDLKDPGGGLVLLDAFGGPYGISARLDPDGEHVRAASAFGIKVPMGRDAAFLVDSDLDGTLGSPGDGVVVPGSRTVGPMTTPRVELWSEREAVTVKKNDDGTWSVASLAMPRPDESDHAAAWRYLMVQRQACGLLPLEYHAELEAGMRLHAEYLQRNKRIGHGETEGAAGFSREGLDAGTTCVLGYEKKSCVEGIREQLGLLFHRTLCLAPDLSGSAMQLHRGTFLVSTSKRVQSPLRGRLLVYPPHGMTNVPCEFSVGGEMPMPVAGKPSPNHLGTPVGVFTMGLYRMENLPEKPALKLVALDSRGRPASSAVEGELHYPGHVPDGGDVGKNYMGNVALIPRSFLKSDTRYRASITVLLPLRRGAAAREDFTSFVYEWEFETGKAARRRVLP